MYVLVLEFTYMHQLMATSRLFLSGWVKRFHNTVHVVYPDENETFRV